MSQPRRLSTFCLLGVFALPLAAQTGPANIATLEQAFRTPPEDARIMMRWWWFGPSVTKPQLELEMRRMKEGGIGGFEVQPVYPLALNDPEHGIRNLEYLSNDFIDALQFTSAKARELGLRMDLTLGSGWPFGGPHIPVNEAAGRLRVDRIAIPAGAKSIAAPHLAEGENLLATFIAKGEARNFTNPHPVQFVPAGEGRVQVPAGADGNLALFFINSHTGMMVKRPAVGAEGFVLDHYDRAALDNHLRTVGDRLMQAFGNQPPFAVFSDSLEVFGSDWTNDLLPEFKKRRGYDLTPYLPALIGDIGDKTAAVRYDWGLTLTELVDERYLHPLQQWAQRHNTKLRSQTYGMPPVTMSSSALVDLPEGEGPHWRQFSESRWAVSASHLYNKPVTSSETWTWLHSPAFRATPLDMKAEADLHFLQGITQLIGHGWAYSPAYAGEPGWRFYAAAVFNHHNPWWLVMPDVTKYMQRVSFLLRQGRPANDVAIYLPTSDARAKFVAGTASVNRSMDAMIGEVIPAVLDAGYNFDFIDDEAIEKIGVPYAAVVLPSVNRIPLAAYRKLREFAAGKGVLLASGRMPSQSPGLLTGERDSAAVRAISQELLDAKGARAKLVRTVAELGPELRGRLNPDVVLPAPPNAVIGFIHRRLPYAQIYFVANTSNQRQDTAATFRVTDSNPEWWDPFTGEVKPAEWQRGFGTGTTIKLDLQPYESRVLVFSTRAPTSPAQPDKPLRTIADASTGWSVQFPNGRPETLAKLHSWTEDEPTRYFSGQATYEKSLTVPAEALGDGARLWLDFGEGSPVQDTRRPGAPGMRALLESPVREAAVVWVNGQQAGSVWHPPYRVDVTKYVRPGTNQIRVAVGNTAINSLAGQNLPDDKLLNLRYGVRFEPQDMKNLEPLPAGILGPVRLLAQ